MNKTIVRSIEDTRSLLFPEQAENGPRNNRRFHWNLVFIDNFSKHGWVKLPNILGES